MKGFETQFSCADVAKLAGVIWAGDHLPATASEPTAWRCNNGHAFLLSKGGVLEKARKQCPACPQCAETIKRVRIAHAADRRSNTNRHKAAEKGLTRSSNGLSLTRRKATRKSNVGSIPRPIEPQTKVDESLNPQPPEKGSVTTPQPEPVTMPIEPTIQDVVSISTIPEPPTTSNAQFKRQSSRPLWVRLVRWVLGIRG